MDLDLIQKYSKPGPRYTSYPTVPFWDEVPPTRDEWISLVRAAFEKSNDSQG
ncbi:MAG: coproporphyrinogen III oxidase, partial [Bacteroidetes bacterium]|nr:coproporphyrinogen III oxidase [Bacteroidota bacterium]